MASPKTLQQAIRHFSDEQVCIDTVASLRWVDGKPTCPACDKQDHYYLKTQKRWKCKECGRQFSVKVGTIFEDSPIPLDKWLTALWMLVSCRNGISSYEVARTLGITQKSAWFLMHRLRVALRDGTISKLGGEGSEVEVDETFIGGKLQNMHVAKRAKYRQISASEKNAGSVGKAVVIGMLDRTARQIRASVVPDTSRLSLQTQVLQNIHHGTNVYTDEAHAYKRLKQNDYVHEVVNHVETYVRGRVHTNGLENFWCLLKRGLNGTYVAVEPFHLERYVDEQAFRFNHRKDAQGQKLSDGDRFDAALARIGGKRLTYSELTGKDSEAPF